MRRRPISASDYAAILGELVITRMHAGVMSVIVGMHRAHGRVVLLRSGIGFVLIADRLEALSESFDVDGLRADTFWDPIGVQVEASRGSHLT